MKRLIIAALTVLLAAACSQNGNNEAITTIAVDETVLNYGAEAQSGLTLRYTVNYSVGDMYSSSGMIKADASTTDEWITDLDDTYTGMVRFGLTANTASVGREGRITLSCGPATVHIAIKQAAGDGSGDGDGGGSGDGGTVNGVWRKGWAELPAENDADGNGIDDNDPTLYYAHHICAGNEKNAQGNYSARNYTVCFSAEHHCPVWIAAPRHEMYNGSANRSDAYGPDPKIPASIQYQQKSAGNSTYNRGHMLGSAERTSSSATNRQVFYYTNIAPQENTSFNNGGGAWNKLEDWVDGKVCADTTYVVIGTYFKDYDDPLRGYKASAKKITYGGRSDVSCPTMFYYAILRTKKGNTRKAVTECSSDELMCAAFVRSHTCAKGTSVSSQDMMSISDLEAITGFTYFANVPNAPKDSFKPSEWGL